MFCVTFNRALLVYLAWVNSPLTDKRIKRNDGKFDEGKGVLTAFWRFYPINQTNAGCAAIRLLILYPNINPSHLP